jgi:ADP-dependent phosphofructokinase/glucokinase
MINTIGRPKEKKARIEYSIQSPDVSNGVRFGDVVMNTGIWEKIYQSMKIPQMDPVITGFNANIDRIIQVTPDLLGSFERHEVPGFDAIFPRLKQSMMYSAADEVFIHTAPEYQKLSEYFSRMGSLTLGGQAGIAAVHLYRLGIPSVTCVVPGAGPRICSLLQDAGVVPLTFASETTNHSDLPHLIFEYAPGLVSPAKGVVPRNNRFIVSPVHDASSVIIPDPSVTSFREQIRSCRRAFLSGYQYLQTEQEFVTAAQQIRLIRSVHPLMRTHMECVSGADRGVMAMMLRHIFPAADSIGLNERELGLFMHTLRKGDQTSPSLLPSSPAANVRDALALADATGVLRVHLHTFGYYILILKSETVQPAVSQNALLCAAKVTADAAGLGKQVLSPEGGQAYAEIRNLLGPDETPGIFRKNDRIVIFVPTYISHNVNKTTGLGDILSSTAFVADRF